MTDIYEQCSIDYSKDAEITQQFFKTVQNKLHWAITGKTAAELIADRADASQSNMGLTTWKNAPKGKVLKRILVQLRTTCRKRKSKNWNALLPCTLILPNCKPKGKSL